MIVTVTDFIGPRVTTLEGDAAQVEQELRRLHPGASVGVAHGDLKTLLCEIGRLPWVVITVRGSEAATSDLR